MAQPSIPGLDVTEQSGTRAVATRPYQPNWSIPTPGPAAPAAPGTAVATRPYQPNFTLPGASPGTGARQPFDYDAKPPTRTEQGMRALRQAGANVMNKIPGSVKTAGRILGKVGAAGGIGATGVEVASDVYGTPTENYYRRFAMDPADAGRNGFKDLGVRAAGALTDLGANILDVPMAAVNGARAFAGADRLPTFRDIVTAQDGGAPGPAALPAALPAPVAPNPLDQRLASTPAMAPNVTAPAGPAITRTGNSFSDGSAPGLLRSVSTIGGPGVAETMQQINNIRGLPVDQGGISGFGHVGGTDSFGPSLSVLGPSGSGMKPRDVRAANALASEERIARARMNNEAGLAGARERGDTNRALISADTQRDITERQIGAQTRGQDITREGNMISAQGTRAQMLRDQQNKNREFDAQQTERNRSATEAAEKSWQGMTETRFRTRDQDGKDIPDATKAANFTRAVDTTLPAFIKMLQQTNTPAALAKANEISQRGRAALGPADQDMLQRLFEKREVAAKSHGVLPGKGSYVHSDNLMDYLTASAGSGALGNDQEIARNGTRIPTAKLMYGPDGNVFLPNFQAPNTNLVGLRQN